MNHKERKSRIIVLNSADFDDQTKWPEQFEWIMATLLKMKKHLKNIYRN